jgi:predicted RNA-binding Zn-ribbon protein involved in translation (DUF1610 family)
MMKDEGRETVEEFTCKNCGRHLELRIRVLVTPGHSEYKATCPHCGKVQGGFPNPVIEVLDSAEESSR